jgi:hypothetical protein
MKYPLLLIVLAILCLAAIHPVCASTITAKVGETWIKWQWVSTEIPANVYVDGKLEAWNTTFNYYYLDGSEALEKHNIQVYNSSNTSQKWEDSTITTLYPKTTVFFLIGIEIVLTLILLLARDNIKIILIGAVTITLALFTSRISIGYEGIYLLPIIIAIAAGAYLVYGLWNAIRGNVSWY